MEEYPIHCTSIRTDCIFYSSSDFLLPAKLSIHGPDTCMLPKPSEEPIEHQSNRRCNFFFFWGIPLAYAIRLHCYSRRYNIQLSLIIYEIKALRLWEGSIVIGRTNFSSMFRLVFFFSFHMLCVVYDAWSWRRENNNNIEKKK